MKKNFRLQRRAVQRLLAVGITAVLSAPCLIFGWVYNCLSSSTPVLLQGAVACCFFVGVLVLFGWLLYVVHHYSRTWQFRVGGFSVLFVWTLFTQFSFLQQDVYSGTSNAFSHRLLQATHRASVVFLTRWKGLDAEAEGGYVLNAQLLQLAIVFYLAALMFSVLGRRAFNQLRVVCTREADKNVFWGLSERDLLLARSIIENSLWEQIQFNLPVEQSYDPSSVARLTDLADEMDAFWTFIDFTRLNSKNCHRGYRHFFLSEDGHRNLALADQVVDAVIADPSACNEKTLYVRAGDIDQVELFAEWARKTYERSGHLIKPMIIHEPEMIARRYVEDYSPLCSRSFAGKVDVRTATVGGVACRTLLLGFDHTGRALLNARLTQSRVIGPDGKTPLVFPITVVDRVRDRWDRYALQAPEIAENCDEFGLSFKCCQVGMTEFESWMRENHAFFDRVVFCLKGDGENIREAIRLRDLLTELNDTDKELIVRVADPSVNQFAQMRNEKILPLAYFGNLREVYSIKFLTTDSVDRIAQLLNWQWNVNGNLEQKGQVARLIHERDKTQIKEQADDVARFWEGASYYDRQSSRASAMAGLSFLRVLGLRCKFKEELGTKDTIVAIDEVNKMIESASDVLARLEHLRWCTYMGTLGYRKWDLKSPCSLDEVISMAGVVPGSGYVPNKLANQLNRFRAHACLIPYDDLADLDLRLAKAVDPTFFSHATAEDFAGRKRPAVAEGRYAASLQCKDFDIWTILPEAIELAGYVFVRHTATLDDPSGSMLQKRIGGRLRAIGSKIRRFKSWMDRKSYAKEVDVRKLSDEELHFVYRAAQWAESIYQPFRRQFVDKGFSPCMNFLSSNLIERRYDNVDLAGRKWTLFWFSDAISSHCYNGKRMAGGKTRYPYLFDRESGLVLPLFRVASRHKRKMLERRLGINGRRVNFMKQPDLVARVFDSPLKTGQQVVVFRGTASCSDWVDDLFQTFGLLPAQFRISADLVRAVCETTNKDLLLVGHSKGGGLVQYALMRNGVQRWTGNRRLDGWTFNSQRLSPIVLERLRAQVESRAEQSNPRSNYAEEHILNLRSRRDIVSGWLVLGVNLLGRVYVVGKPGRLGFRDHSIKGMIKVLANCVSIRETEI